MGLITESILSEEELRDKNKSGLTYRPSGETVEEALSNLESKFEAFGAAKSATKLYTPRKIGNASFDGSKDISLKDIGIDIETIKNSIINSIMPVGHVLITSDPTNPGTYLPGTWKQITDRMIVAASDVDAETKKYKVNSTGGSESVTLDVKNLPSHSHTFTGSASVGNNSVTPSATFTGTAVNSSNQSANHSHSIPSLGGSTSASGHHKHPLINTTSMNADFTVGCIDGIGEGYSGIPARSNWGSYQYGHWFTGLFQAGPGGDHSHSIATNEGATGANSTSHLHSVTAKGSVSLSNTTHTHNVSISGSNANTGDGVAHDNMPPYIVKYIWERTA